SPVRELVARRSCSSGRNGSVCRARQMSKAIFFPIARDTKFQARIGQFCSPTGGATMKGFLFGAGLDLETLSSDGHLFALAQLLNRPRSKKDQVIAQGGDKSEPIGI